MENVPVTIIVKAPNQQIEDVQIQCELSWTIKRLKGYLSEVYPSKPSSEEQKLIYSGQLLNDTVILKDVLRQYEGQDTHTVHLVFTPKNYELGLGNTPKETPKHFQLPNSDSLRRRNVLNSSRNTMANSYTQMPANVQQSTHGQLHQNVVGSVSYSTTPLSAATIMQENPSYEYIMAQQMAMQQFYMQYMNQYMNVVRQVNNPTSQTTSQTIPFLTSNVGVNNNQSDTPVATAAVNEPLPNHQIQQPPPAVVQPADNNAADEGERLDWLDMFYVFSRLMILVALVYVYSSPVRFMIVTFFTALYYLYHIFRQANSEANNNNNRILRQPNEEQLQENNANNNNAPQPRDHPNQNNDGPIVNTTLQPANNEEQQDNNNPVSQSSDHEQNNRLPMIALLRTFVLSFFSSLIPETPAL